MLIQDALKETGKAVRKGFDWCVEECQNGEHSYRAISLVSGGVVGYEIAIRHVFAADWEPYREVKEIRPEKAGELWFNVNNRKYAHTSDYDGNGQTFWHEDCYVPRDISQIQDKVVHNQGWRRLSPPVENDSVERLVFENITFKEKKGHICAFNECGAMIGPLGGPPMRMILEKAKNCSHGKGFNDYCEPCGRTHGG